MVVVGSAVGCLLVVAVAVFLVGNRGPEATAQAGRTGLPLPGGASAGGETVGQARALTDVMVGDGMECSVRFTSPQGGHAGCFGYTDQGRTATELVFQYRPDGAVIGLNARSTAAASGMSLAAIEPVIRALSGVVFPEDQPRVMSVISALEQSPGALVRGSWGEYEIVDLQDRTTVSAAKADAVALQIPRVDLETTEPALAKSLRSRGFTCARDNERCGRKVRDSSGTLSVGLSGPNDGGITYLTLTASDTSPQAKRAAVDRAFAGLTGTVFSNLRGDGVKPLRDWVARHRDGKSHTAFVAGWRVDLHVTRGGEDVPTKYLLTVFNEEVWLVP